MGKNRVSNKELRNSTASERDIILAGAYGGIDLASVRAIDDYAERYLVAAAALYQAALASGIVPEDAKAQLTTTNIAAVAEEEWVVPSIVVRTFGKRVAMHFGSAEWLRQAAITWVQRLPAGKQVCQSEGCIEAILTAPCANNERYPRGVEPSNWDLLQGTRIPEVCPELMFMLGVYLGDSYADDHLNQLTLLGTQHDFPFYEGTVSPMIKQLFNLRCPVKSSYSKSCGIHSPKINISSQAHHSWLATSGFPVNGNKISIDFKGDNLLRQSFFKGVVASMGNIDPTHKALKMPDTSMNKLYFIAGVASGLGYAPQVKEKYRMLFFTREQTRSLAGQGFYENPRHKLLLANANP